MKRQTRNFSIAMAAWAIIFCLMYLLVGCSYEPVFVPAVPASKKVIDKVAPIENRVSGTDILFGSGSVTKSVTVFYLIADDGSICEVPISVYTSVKTGTVYASHNWVEMSQGYWK